MEEIKYKVINRINTVDNSMYISEDGNYVMNVSELFCGSFSPGFGCIFLNLLTTRLIKQSGSCFYVL